MRVYYDPGTMKPTYSFEGPSDMAPGGDFLEVDPADLTAPLAAYEVVDGALVEIDLAPRQDEAKAQAGRAVATARLRYITDLPAQGLIYSEKEAEAKAYLSADPEPASLDAFPWIKREVGVTGSTAYEVAQVFSNMAALWRNVGPEIEGLRLEATAAISAAGSEPEVNAALDNLRAGLEALP